MRRQNVPIEQQFLIFGLERDVQGTTGHSKIEHVALARVVEVPLLFPHRLEEEIRYSNMPRQVACRGSVQLRYGKRSFGLHFHDLCTQDHVANVELNR